MSAKKIITLIAVFALTFVTISIAKRKLSNTERKRTVMTIPNDSHDFKKLKLNSPAQTYFHIVNDGNEPLKISKVETRCGCTVPDWPKIEIPPGEKDSILVTYDASQLGQFHRSVIVYSNSISSPNILYIKGEVQ